MTTATTALSVSSRDRRRWTKEGQDNSSSIAAEYRKVSGSKTKRKVGQKLLRREINNDRKSPFDQILDFLSGQFYMILQT